MQKEDILLRDEFQAIALRHGGDEQRNFGQRQLRADANTRAAAERQIGKARPRRAAFA